MEKKKKTLYKAGWKKKQQSWKVGMNKAHVKYNKK